MKDVEKKLNEIDYSIKSLILYIFPNLKIGTNIFYNDYEFTDKDRRLSNNKFFEVYFTNSDNEYLRIICDIEDFMIKYRNDKSILNNIVDIFRKYDFNLYSIILNDFLLYYDQKYDMDLKLFKKLINFFINHNYYSADFICELLIKVSNYDDYILSINNIRLLNLIINIFDNNYIGNSYISELNNDYNKKKEKIINKINEKITFLFENIINNHQNIFSKKFYYFGISTVYKKYMNDKYDIVNFLNKRTVFKIAYECIYESYGKQFFYEFDKEKFNSIFGNYVDFIKVIKNININKLNDDKKKIYNLVNNGKRLSSNTKIDVNNL